MVQQIEKLLEEKAIELGFTSYTQLVVDQEWDALDKCHMHLYTAAFKQMKEWLEHSVKICRHETEQETAMSDAYQNAVEEIERRITIKTFSDVCHHYIGCRVRYYVNSFGSPLVEERIGNLVAIEEGMFCAIEGQEKKYHVSEIMPILKRQQDFKFEAEIGDDQTYFDYFVKNGYDVFNLIENRYALNWDDEKDYIY